MDDMGADMSAEKIIEEIDKLRLAAIKGDLAAADRAMRVPEHLATKTSAPPAYVRVARCLALEARGWALRNSGNTLLIRLGGASDNREDLSRAVRAALEEWKKACDALVDECIRGATENDRRTAAATLYMRSHLHLHEVLAYVRVAPWDHAFQSEMPVFVMEGVARAVGARDAWADLGIDEMRLMSMAIEMEWHWVGGDHAKAREVAQKIVSDPCADGASDYTQRARLVLTGRSPLPEYDMIPARE